MQKQFQIKKILIPFDFSETAELSLEHAVHMARLHKAEILLLHVVESASFTSAIAHAFSKGYEKDVEGETTRKLEEVARKIHQETSVQVSIKTDVGRIYKKIVSVSRDNEVDIIVMGTHGTSGYERFSVGTNTAKVVSESSCPVLSVQTHAKKIGFKRIVLPIDDSTTSRQKVNYALEIARHYGSHVYVLGLINFGNEEAQRKFKIKVDQVEEWLHKHQVSSETHYVHGDNLAKLTMEYSEKVDADLVVIMTEQEFVLTGFFMGTWATQVVNHSKIPVMTVHPDEVSGDKISAGY